MNKVCIWILSCHLEIKFQKMVVGGKRKKTKLAEVFSDRCEISGTYCLHTIVKTENCKAVLKQFWLSQTDLSFRNWCPEIAPKEITPKRKLRPNGNYAQT